MSQTFARLRIDNYDTAIPFYIDYLGFAIAWEYRENGNANVYIGITRGTSPGIQSGTLELHLTEFPGDQPPKTQVMFDVEAVYDLYADLQSRKPDIAEIITDQPWAKANSTWRIPLATNSSSPAQRLSKSLRARLPFRRHVRLVDGRVEKSS